MFWDYGGLPRLSTVFWTVLTVIDPAAGALLFPRPNAGIIATVVIIVTDVAHNVWTEATYFPPLLRGLAHAPRL